MKNHYVIAIHLMRWLFMISGLNEQLQQQSECTLLKPDYQSWWDTLEERYAIKFCLKLGKNSTGTYGMLQTAFRTSWMNRASVFEWHKRFKEGRESMRDDERCGRIRKSIHQSWLAKGLGLGLQCWWASKLLLSIPIVQTLLPVTFGFSQSSEAVIMR